MTNADDTDLSDLMSITEAPCGVLIFEGDGKILSINDTLLSWIELDRSEVPTVDAPQLFTVASRVLFETSMMPLLALQGSVDGASLDLRARNSGGKVPVLLSAACKDHDGRRITHIVFLLATARRSFEQDLASARDTAKANLELVEHEAEMREQFVAILGHDLRNPLAAIHSAARMLSREALSDRGTQILDLTYGSIGRMSRLIDNVLDFARNRLGGGIVLDLSDGSELTSQVSQVVEELQSAHPERVIELSNTLTDPVECDVWRVGQLLSNLVGNAVTHGDPTQPIRVAVGGSDGGGLRLCVTNHGKPIPPSKMETLFDPFVSNGEGREYRGLGLGLYIASEIAQAHGGAIDVTSTTEATHFCFNLPAPSER